MHWNPLIAVAAVVGANALTAHAEPLSIEQEPASALPETTLAFTFEPGDSMPASAESDPFAEGSWVWQAYGAAAFGDSAGELYSGHFGVGYHFVDDLSINFDGMIAWADASGSDDVIGVGLELIFRWHFYHEQRWSIFGDVGGGIVLFDDDFPAGGTEFNFSLSAGLGATYRFGDELMLMLGVRWYHLSNARISGKDRNIGYDAAGVYLGVMKPF